ncbi:MAG TPA: 3-hydroxyacyl-ACP dehydratase FabZ [Candidatus Sumerlaeota bacterium]|nr:MAG: 3-hydroxyacyl-(acyl-carrier-protein) dehydratase FabZ [candidate division BRC1 bacterium ADurb.Bin183]HOE63201.1 3-hydroxyacyl-ACP dehydratase FabZ [Candidatus Sumerlaeota bacterium]HRR30883.1 3-hydroxyacyl-ACP dehydratase FabZ [Candidatus Sumerlaeia bacterium]HON50559.1 3-hydroxyacyl-ACP dehydratase FabZ [Candidatus Sumerlaeota bacterium]HOR65381.1 3-hydroxyacyl-ACP dehydratase FabZ [Candidatus Sumerlaeota bacterium]
MSEPKIYTPPLDVEQICEIIPHRFPFLLVDKVLNFDEQGNVEGYKNLTINEPFFQGHFPVKPIMPGVLVIEALAQMGAVFILAKPENRGRIAFLAGVDNARFRRPVVPGDRLDLKLCDMRLKGSFGKVHGIASVNGQIAAEADISFMLAPNTRSA